MQILPYLLLLAILAANVILLFIKAPVILLAAVIIANFPLQCLLAQQLFLMAQGKYYDKALSIDPKNKYTGLKYRNLRRVKYKPI